LNGEFTLIEKSVYEVISKKAEKYIGFNPISEITLTKNHPEIFKTRDSCYIFPMITNNAIGNSTDELKVCKNLVQTKEYSNYEFKGVYFGNALIETTAYEGWGYLSIDLSNGLTFSTMGKPLTSQGETCISYSNYYGEEEITLTDLKTKKQFLIVIEGWFTKESKVIMNDYYLKLEPLPGESKAESKYLKINIRKN